MAQLTRSERIFMYVLLILYVSGVVWYSIPSVGLKIGRLSSFMLFLSTGGIFYFTFRGHWHLPSLLWVGLAFAFTIAMEIVGVATYKVFGPYYYYPTLQPQIMKVPILIGINWVMLAYGAVQLLSRPNVSPLLAGGLAAILMTGFDYIMEPIAVKLQYWYWIGDQIPLQNFIAWFLIALVICIPLAYIRQRPRRPIIAWFFIIQLGFFAALRITL